MKVRANVCVAAALCAALWGPTWAFAGPITPPPGPVVGTYKTLVEVEPRIALNAVNTPGDGAGMFTISQSGSYYLTGDLLVDLNKAGIRITAASGSVTIDLNGYAIRGQGGNSAGIRTDPFIATPRSTVVRNGRIRDVQTGIDIIADEAVVSDVGVDTCTGSGILLDSLVAPAVFERCTVTRVTATAIRTDRQAIPSRFPAVVRDCVVRSGAGTGIAVGPRSLITGCSIEGGNGGIRVGETSAVSGCTVTATTGIGIFVDLECLVSDSVASSNLEDGISCGSGSSVRSCIASGNGGDGIIVASASSVVACTTFANVGDGIQISGDCLVLQCIADSNGSGVGNSAGIHATSTDNRIEGNNCTDNDRGIDVDSTGSIIVRNTCSGNTVNWDVASGNVCLVVSATAAPAVLGNAGGTAPGSTDPNANFTY